MILFALSIFKLKIATSYPHEMMVLLTIAVRCFKDWVKFPVSLLRNQSIEFLEMDQTPSNTYQKNIKNMFGLYFDGDEPPCLHQFWCGT